MVIDLTPENFDEIILNADLPVLISGAIGLYFSYQENKSALSSVQREKALGAAARIEQFIRQIEQQLTFAALQQLGSGADGMEQRLLEFHKLQRLL